MNDKERIRSQVSEAYAKAVSAPLASCCGPAPVQKGVAAKIAGYTRDELKGLPPDAVANSFGCGNPLAYSGVKEGDVVLDLGSGAGIDILIAAKIVGPTGRVIGVDMTDDMIERARQNIDAAGFANVEVRKGIIEDMPVESSSVDWVISNCVINLSPEKDKVFSEIARVLKPGGHMLVSDIVVKELPEFLRDNTALYCSCVAGAISEEDYIKGLEGAGLDSVEVVDRLVYDTMQIAELAKTESPQENATGCGCGCGGGSVSDKLIGQIAKSLQGKIWSAKFSARKS